MKKPIIVFKDFTFRYKTQKTPTLQGINLTIYEGEKVLILGPSGCGKSTLMNCINGLIPFSYKGEMQGSVQVAGLETRHASIFKLSEHVGTIQQDTDAQFVGLSVGEDIAFALENRAMPRQEMVPEVERTAKVVGMEDFLGQPPYQLSGGQKQKVALAGVLHDEEEILLFDEPLAALDPAMGMMAVDLIDRIHKEQHKTVLIIEHRLEDVLYRPVDRIVFMDKGTIRFDATPDQLLASGLLKEHGIREPLYISALKNAGVTFDGTEHLADLDGLDTERYKPALLAQFNAAEPFQAPSRGELLLQVRHVDYAYDGRKALDDVSFDVCRGERIAIVGKNGAGKSTMAKLLCGIIRPQSGSVSLNGENYLALSIRQIGRLVGYVMQNPNQMLVKDMIADEVRLALELNGFDKALADERVEKTLKMCGLWTMRSWPVSVLSYGQKKRVTIASILALEPDVIILDEPTAGQDYFHYTEIMGFLEQLNREHNVMILFITHDMHLAIEYTDRAIVFADGRCIADDFVFKVLSDKDVIERANLKETSLVTLARQVGLDPEAFIRRFIEQERRERKDQTDGSD